MSNYNLPNRYVDTWHLCTQPQLSVIQGNKHGVSLLPLSLLGCGQVTTAAPLGLYVGEGDGLPWALSSRQAPSPGVRAVEHVQRKAYERALYRLAACQAAWVLLVVGVMWLG